MMDEFYEIEYLNHIRETF